jgi:hypothetical protein
LARTPGAALLALALLVAGCGGSGASAGATVSVYVGAPLCEEAQAAVERAGGRAGDDLKVRAVCLPPVGSRGGISLAAAGANARRASEDSTAVAFLEAPGPAAGFSQPIVEAADIAWLETGSGSAAMRRVLVALGEAGSSSPRAAVLDEVG